MNPMMGEMVSSVALDIFEKQSKIIELQSDAIEGLYMLLLQYIETSELENLPVSEKLNEVAKIRKENGL